ncbi:hypothetical protein ERS070088_02589, partial [Streptococcus pneumoniae]
MSSNPVILGRIFLFQKSKSIDLLLLYFSCANVL